VKGGYCQFLICQYWLFPPCQPWVSSVCNAHANLQYSRTVHILFITAACHRLPLLRFASNCSLEQCSTFSFQKKNSAAQFFKRIVQHSGNPCSKELKPKPGWALPKGALICNPMMILWYEVLEMILMCRYGVFFIFHLFIISLNICGLLKATILYRRYSQVYFEIVIRHDSTGGVITLPTWSVLPQ